MPALRRLLARPSTPLVAILTFSALTSITPAVADSLELPAQARIDVSIIEGIDLDASGQRLDDVMLKPAADAEGRTDLPHYCVLIGDAKRDGQRLRITTEALTCVETDGGESHIYSGELIAGAYDEDGQFGIDACTDSGCRLDADRVFQLELTEPLAIEQMPNPSAELNAERRGEGADNEANQATPSSQTTPSE